MMIPRRRKVTLWVKKANKGGKSHQIFKALYYFFNIRKYKFDPLKVIEQRFYSVGYGKDKSYTIHKSLVEDLDKPIKGKTRNRDVRIQRIGGK